MHTLLIQLSKKLHTEVLAVMQYDVTGTWRDAEILEGKLVGSYFSEEDDKIEELLESKLKQKNIFQSLYMFREIINERGTDTLKQMMESRI